MSPHELSCALLNRVSPSSSLLSCCPICSTLVQQEPAALKHYSTKGKGGSPAHVKPPWRGFCPPQPRRSASLVRRHGPAAPPSPRAADLRRGFQHPRSLLRAVVHPQGASTHAWVHASPKQLRFSSILCPADAHKATARSLLQTSRPTQRPRPHAPLITGCTIQPQPGPGCSVQNPNPKNHQTRRPDATSLRSRRMPRSREIQRLLCWFV